MEKEDFGQEHRMEEGFVQAAWKKRAGGGRSRGERRGFTIAFGGRVAMMGKPFGGDGVIFGVKLDAEP